MRGQVPMPDKEEESSSTDDSQSAKALEKPSSADREREHEEEREQEAFDYSYDDDWERRQSAGEVGPGERPRFERIKTGQSLYHAKSRDYEPSPFELDRVNTTESFKRSNGNSRATSPARSLKNKKSNKSMKSTKSQRQK